MVSKEPLFTPPSVICSVATAGVATRRYTPTGSGRPKMEKAVEELEHKMKKTDERFEDLAVQVGNIEQDMFADDVEEVQVNNLLRSVNEVKSNYMHLKKELGEVQDLQRQLSTTLHMQLKMMQTKFNTLKEKVYIPESHLNNIQRTRDRNSRD
ncbi:uncharacterized protein LOC109597924 isoform X1 [Aethina tumida]|uniref:uncharacterized protein LOC109597924 isoform X1 n=2 Tax=Aethina tumida TaxID=116153 RepID=UPI002149767A|nr:uncharacterized protein LOC109597924 isoform X1 [Aethina tumida]